MAMPPALLWLRVPEAQRARVEYGEPAGRDRSMVMPGYVAQVRFFVGDTLYWAGHPVCLATPWPRLPISHGEIATQLLQRIPGSTHVTMSYGFVSVPTYAAIVGN